MLRALGRRSPYGSGFETASSSELPGKVPSSREAPCAFVERVAPPPALASWNNHDPSALLHGRRCPSPRIRLPAYPLHPQAVVRHENIDMPHVVNGLLINWFTRPSLAS